MTTFADVSHYQSVDLAAYKRAGYDRIAMKATGGALDGTLQFVDNTFADRWRLAGQLGLARVAYHFARNNNAGGDEFAWCWSQIQAAGGMTVRDVLCYDSEDNRSQQMIGLARQRMVEFVNAAVRAGVTTGWVYTGKWYADPAGLTAAAVPAAGWRHLWISDYTAGQPDDQIEVPAGWTRDQIVARQYTDAANLPGIPATDANRVIREWLHQQEDLIMDAATKTYLDGQFAAVSKAIGTTWYGDSADDTKDAGTHPYNLQALVKAQQGQAAAIAALSALVASGANDLTAEEVETAVRTALAEALVHVDVSVHGQPIPGA